MSLRSFKNFVALGSASAFFMSLMVSVGYAQEAASNPGVRNWGLGFPEPVTSVADKQVWFHDGLLLPIITVISLFVLALLLYVMFRFREGANPEPSTTTHHTWLEVAWTAIPALILVVIAFPSFSLLYYMDKAEDADMTLKITGNQWNWTYQYPDHGDLEFTASMIPDGEEVNTPRLLGTDNVVVVPSDTIVKVLITASDVLHSWSMQPFGIKMDAVPGRDNETWFRVPAEHEGVYYGQCSEICGQDHAFMPIMVQVVSRDLFDRWTKQALQAVDLGENVPAPADVVTSLDFDLPKEGTDVARLQRDHANLTQATN